ncbi:uncharacterized protein C9orf43 homolog [Rattus norvegicus]|uniref:Similar to human chromosome 9 open reading frame 43 n=1 Tax=Rattus norvegicus TaxID=10116 RepID=E9PT13_RAT|nr:uncharacterized protein C9orf43 homolog [Rattus norvegicus]
MRLRSSIRTGSVMKGRKAFDSMRVVDESQWDEAVCTLAGCQHPQCWASLRRIERGHPRILDTSSKSPWESEDKLPTLTVVNIMDTCLWAKKRVVQRQASEFTFPKERSLLLKPASKCHGRSWKSLRDKDATSHSRPPKLSVLNLNEAKLPFSGDDRNMVVTWVPEEMAKKTIQEKAGVPSRSVKKRRKKWGETSKPSLYYRGRRYLRSPAVLVPPPSPVHFLEQLHSEAIPLWAQVDMLPQDLLKECILSHEKSTACPEVKMELSKMKKSLPLEKSRPDSAVSSKMYLTIQRLTLQRPSLRYPDCLKKLRHNLKRDSWKQQEEKTSTKKQEAKKKAKRDVEEQYGEETMSSDSFHDPSFHDHVGLRISRREIERKLLKGEVGMEKTSLERRVSVEEPMAYEFGSYYTASYYTSPESALLYETIYQDLNDGEETELEVEAFSKDNNPKSLSAVMDNISWNPELKLLRILQATEEENEEGHLSRAQSEASLEA